MAPVQSAKQGVSSKRVPTRSAVPSSGAKQRSSAKKTPSNAGAPTMTKSQNYMPTPLAAHGPNQITTPKNGRQEVTPKNASKQK